MLRRFCMSAARSLAAPSAVGFVIFAMASICLATGALQLFTLLGTSQPVLLGFVAAVSIGVMFGSGRIAFLSRINIAGFGAVVLLQFLLAAWMVATPQIIHFADWAISQPGVIRLASPLWNGSIMFALALGLAGFPAAVIGQLAVQRTALMTGRSEWSLVFLGGSAGLLFWSLGLAQILGLHTGGLIAACIGLAASLYDSIVRVKTATAAGNNASSVENSDAVSLPDTHFGKFLALLQIVICGVWGAIFDRFIVQFHIDSIFLGCAETIGLGLGIAAGCFCVSRFPKLQPTFGWLAPLFLSAAGVAVLALFAYLVDASLWLNAHVSTTVLLILGKGCLAASIMLPVGFAVAVNLTTVSRQSSSPSFSSFIWLIPSGAAAFIFCSLFLFSRISLPWLTVILSWSGAAPVIHALRSNWPIWLTGWKRTLPLGMAAALVVAAPVFTSQYDPVRSAKILFNSNVAYAYRTGIRSEFLAVLDEGRHISTVDGSRGPITIWSYGGHQRQLRENGLPRGVATTDAMKFPRYCPETLQTLIPCVLQGKTERLLLLGLGSGESLATALAFPIPEIACLETDAGLVKAVRLIHTTNDTTIFDDERLTLTVCDPAYGLAAVDGEFDVIVSSPENLSLIQTQPYVTNEFYRRAADKLSNSGIFCQRLQHIDLGPMAIQTIVRSLRTAFQHIQAVEAAPGELLLCATNAEENLFRAEMVGRLELPHVRAILADSGLDWSVVLNIYGVDEIGLDKFSQNGSTRTNSAIDGNLVFKLPRDMMRWAPKIEEFRTALSQTSGRPLDWLGPISNSQVVMRRLAEVHGQQNLMNKVGDQYWAYRKPLREQLQQKPRSAIELTSGVREDQTHVEDRRRAAYFKALGNAVKHKDMASINRMVELSTPYDPLLTYFARQEAAELWSQAPARDFTTEFELRLYAVYFGSSRDSSVRNVLAALDLLCDHPECEPDPLIRWDLSNALLQSLKQRWDARLGTTPANPKEWVIEIDRSILVAERMLRLLDESTISLNLSQTNWKSRRTVLESMFIASIRSFQSQLLSQSKTSGREQPSP